MKKKTIIDEQCVDIKRQYYYYHQITKTGHIYTRQIMKQQ